MNNQLTYLAAKIEQTSSRQANASVERSLDNIVPIQCLPLIPVVGQVMIAAAPIPAVFPNTKRDLFNLTMQNVNALLQYYGLANVAGDSRQDKQAKLAAYLGIPHQK